jgi:integrase
LFSWLYLEGEIEANPMVRIVRPRRVRPEDLDVVIVTPAEVEKMLGACRDWQEFETSPGVPPGFSRTA